MEVVARLRHLQGSPQKMRLVADLIRGKDVEDAVAILQHTKKRAAGQLVKLVKSAVANAENRDEELDVDLLYVKEIFVDGGPAMKRVWFTTMGRAYRKLKRQSHVTVKLDTRREEE
jgi:large subunit ribosomal protein L22